MGEIPPVTPFKSGKMELLWFYTGLPKLIGYAVAVGPAIIRALFNIAKRCEDFMTLIV